MARIHLRILARKATIAAMAAVAACGQSGDARLSGADGCPPEVRGAHHRTLTARLTDPAVSWFEVRQVEIRRGAVDPPRDLTALISLDTVRVLRGAPPPLPAEVGAFTPDASEAVEAVRRGDRLLAGVVFRPDLERGAYVRDLVAIEKTGGVRFIGWCAEATATAPFLSAVAAGGGGRSPAEVLQRAIADVSFAATLLQHSPVEARWEDRPAAARSLNPEDAPASALAPLGWVHLIVTVPEDWRGRDATLCGRITLGWGDCLRLGQTPVDGRLAGLTLPVAPGEPTELWLLGPDASYRSAIARVARVDDGVLSQVGYGRGVDATVELTPGPTPRSFEAISAGTPGGPDLVLVRAEKGLPGMIGLKAAP